VTISNVPGPPFPLFLGGARMVGFYPLGPVAEGVGLNMTVMSYCGIVYFGLNGCRETVTRMAELPAMIDESMDELLALARPARRKARAAAAAAAASASAAVAPVAAESAAASASLSTDASFAPAAAAPDEEAGGSSLAAS
jgi:hypothetical protein